MTSNMAITKIELMDGKLSRISGCNLNFGPQKRNWGDHFSRQNWHLL